MLAIPRRKLAKTVAGSPAFIRFLAACLLTAVAALALSACGDGGTATGETAPVERQVSPTGAAQPCPAKVDALLEDLGRLRRQLAVGLSYDQYAARVKQLNAAYAAISVDQLTIGCLRTAATPAERALNKYIDGVNAWGECLADAACTTATIEPVLQRKWRAASHFLSEAS